MKRYFFFEDLKTDSVIHHSKYSYQVEKQRVLKPTHLYTQNFN